MEPEKQLPIIILAGADRRPASAPAGVDEFHPLRGYKGAEIRVAGRTLVELLVERLRASQEFCEVYVVGPARVYADLVDCPVVDTDGMLDDNLRAAIREVQSRHGNESRMAIVSCDILPSVDEIRGLTRALVETDEDFDSADLGPAALALSLVTTPKSLGASGWKPKYRIRPSPGAELVPFLPGHLGILWPARLRMGFFLRLVGLVYKERNRDYDERRRYIVLRIMGLLLWRDFMNLLRLRPPTLTYRVLSRGLGAFLLWRKGELTLESLTAAIGAVLVRRKHYSGYGRRSVQLVITPHRSFAKDIDTEEELDELLRSAPGNTE